MLQLVLLCIIYSNQQMESGCSIAFNWHDIVGGEEESRRQCCGETLCYRHWPRERRKWEVSFLMEWCFMWSWNVNIANTKRVWLMASCDAYKWFLVLDVIMEWKCFKPNANFLMTSRTEQCFEILGAWSERWEDTNANPKLVPWWMEVFRILEAWCSHWMGVIVQAQSEHWREQEGTH